MHDKIAAVNVVRGDALEELKKLPDNFIQTCITSPPYWGLRNYQAEGQIGMEESPEEYVSKLVGVFSEAKRVLKENGTLWLNLGDSYWGSGGFHCTTQTAGFLENVVASGSAGTVRTGKNDSGLKAKDLAGIPWRVALALQADGWYLRSDIIWNKPNPMPESVGDRPTKCHEYIFLLSKNEEYLYNQEAILEPYEEEKESMLRAAVLEKYKDIEKANGKSLARVRENRPNPLGRNRRSVWTISTAPSQEEHYASYPEKLALLCILAGSNPGDVVLDPFSGSGTTLLTALKAQRKAWGIELNPQYKQIIDDRILEIGLLPLMQ